MKRMIPMTPILLNGKTLSNELEKNLKSNVETFKEAYDISPSLAIIMIGDNESCIKYTRMKRDAANRVGIECINIDLPSSITEKEVIKRINDLNQVKDVHGIMIQHPISSHLNMLERKFFDTIDPNKDVDGLTSTNFGKLSLNSNPVSFRPATPKGILILLDEYSINLEEKHVVIIGSSPILGLPLSMMMHHRRATVSICNINTSYSCLNTLCQSADIIVGACGVPNLINPTMIRRGAVLIDVGCCPGTEGVFTPETYKKSSYYTKPLGGVGPMTIITLLIQTLQAARKATINEIC